jgi:hypothetical protein
MIRTWSFATCICGKRHKDEVFAGKRIPKTIKCECGRRVGWATKKINGIHATHSGLYGRYEPGLGVFVESYGHKKELMRELGVEEASDPVGGSRCHYKEEPNPRVQNNSTWMDDADLATAQAEAIARAARGDFDLTME